MPSNDPGPLSWTLRFKHHKTTILLFVEPLQSFHSIKMGLIQALNATRPDGKLDGLAIPSDPEEVLLGLPRNPHDLGEGWVALEIPEVEILEEDGGKRKIGGKQGILNTSPQGAKLKDGAVLAFKFRRNVADMDAHGMALEDEEQWDVLVPSYEDEYGSQAEEGGSS
ncbi:MAG: hypothetical protein M1819_006579 [Sarea resinae]|nr:MAG: hypothetical protein M1819_006579 [Sarea resinae]